MNLPEPYAGAMPDSVTHVTGCVSDRGHINRGNFRANSPGMIGEAKMKRFLIVAALMAFSGWLVEEAARFQATLARLAA